MAEASDTVRLHKDEVDRVEFEAIIEERMRAQTMASALHIKVGELIRFVEFDIGALSDVVLTGRDCIVRVTHVAIYEDTLVSFVLDDDRYRPSAERFARATHDVIGERLEVWNREALASGSLIDTGPPFKHRPFEALPESVQARQIEEAAAIMERCRG